MRSVRSALPALAAVPLLAMALSGCLSDSDGLGPEAGSTFDPRWAEIAVPYGAGHDHFDVTHHQGLSTPNFELIGYDPLIGSHYEHTAPGHLCGDAVSTDDQELAVVHSLSSDVAFTLLDVTDPVAPVILGEFILPRSGSRDVALTPDGGFVAIAVSTPGTADDDPAAGAAASSAATAAAGVSAAAVGPGIVPSLSDAADLMPRFRSACDGSERPVPVLTPGPEQDLPFPPGVMLVDVRDPADMAIVDFYPQPLLGGHSVTAGEAGGATIILSSVVNLATAASNFWFFEVMDTPAGVRMVPRSAFQDNAAAANAPLLNGHNDGWVQDHPVTGMPVAYLANWNQGVTILDISNLAAPTVIGRWYDNEGPNADLQSDGTGSVHEAFPMSGTLGDRHYTFIGQEILAHPAETPSGWVRVLDTTDPSDPHVVAEWTLPTEVEWEQPLVWSTHYLDYYGTTLFVAHYHGGVWAIDLSGLPDETYPPAIGVFVPDKVSPAPPPDASYDWTPTIMEANVLGTGDLVVWDSASGAYVVRFHEDDPAPGAVWEAYPHEH